MAVSPHHSRFKSQVGQLFKSKLSKTPTHQSNSMLEIAESHCFLHEYITIDNFFITDNQAMREWTRFQHWLKRQSFHSWMIWLSRASQHSDSDESMRCLVFFFFTSSLSLNYTSMRKSEDSKGVVEAELQSTEKLDLLDKRHE